MIFFFFSSRRRHTRLQGDWSSDVCSSDLGIRERQHGLKAGAIAYLEKPVSREALEDSFNKIGQFIDQQVKRLLVVEDDATQRQSMIELIAHEDVEITAVASAEEALEKLRTMHFDCMVL